MILLDYDIEEIKKLFQELGQPSFRAAQLYKWMLCDKDFDEMTDLPKGLRATLKEKFIACPIKIIEALKSTDGSIKFLYKLSDDNLIEGVFMPHDYGNTLCISTQVGCRMGCEFCASGIDGLVQNLTSGEILGQVVAVNSYLGGDASERKISNLVLMGSGEPLDNFDNTIKFLSNVSAPWGMNIGRRNISLSTCGLADKIRELADLDMGVTLSISLHATLDEQRQKIMPIAKRYSVTQVIEAAKYYFVKTRRRVIFEYSMIKDVNMNYLDAKRLSEFVCGMSAHVNLIMLNAVEGKSLKGCSLIEGERFCEKLKKLGVSATIRRSMGADIEGACGQLRQKRLKK